MLLLLAEADGRRRKIVENDWRNRLEVQGN